MEPPELLITTVGEAGPVISVRVVEPVSVTVVGEILAVGGVAVGPVAPPEPCAASVVVTVPSALPDVESVAVDVVSDSGVAKATPGTATAVPIPSAIARAPVRPMYRAHRVLTVVVGGAGRVSSCEVCLGRIDLLARLLLSIKGPYWCESI
jgi:hypothetical protein